MAKKQLTMESNESRQLKDIFIYISQQKLGRAIREARSFVNGHQMLVYKGELERVEEDYRLMLDYMKRGFNDPKRDDVFNNIADRLYRFACNLRTAYRKRTDAFFTEMAQKAATLTVSKENIRTTLENFVADTAMLSLETEPGKSEKSKQLYRNHNDFMQSLFCNIVISDSWNGHDKDFFETLILSPTIDTIDAQMLVSAITLGAMNCMDDNKFGTLIDVYLKSTDEKVRQKALIGWVFALSCDTRQAEKAKQRVAEAMRHPGVTAELADLQKQIIFCMNAEQDTDTIQRDIMPDLIKNNNLKITRFGIQEKEEDPMQDVFDPEASDRAMEKMEQSFQKMINMQKAGSDIYFGGFSQMKRFPFFYKAANWFCPFYIEHPDISATVEKMKGTPLIANILENGPFCDSDKYSFTLAVSSVIAHLPDNMKEMLNTKEAMGPAMSIEEQNSPAYIRRMILQDMYRFFRLYPQRGQMTNPFSKEHSIFVTDKVFEGTDMAGMYADLCYFMLKRKNKSALEAIMAAYDDKTSPKSLLVHGLYYLDIEGKPDEAARWFDALKKLEPENRRATSLLARSKFECGDYASAAAYYNELLQSASDNSTAALNYCVALSKAKKYDEALNTLYKLDIEHPDSMPVIRVLAWTLMGVDKYEQAEKAYNRLLNSEETENGDWLNAGYCQWFMGNTNEAVRLFKTFTKSRSNTKAYGIDDDFANDADILADHGINAIDMQLMADLVAE